MRIDLRYPIPGIPDGLQASLMVAMGFNPEAIEMEKGDPDFDTDTNAVNGPFLPDRVRRDPTRGFIHPHTGRRLNGKRIGGHGRVNEDPEASADSARSKFARQAPLEFWED